MSNPKPKRYLNGFNVGQYFNIKGKAINQLREKLRGTEHLVAPEKKAKHKTMPFLYDLDYLLSQFKPARIIPEHLIIVLEDTHLHKSQ